MALQATPGPDFLALSPKRRPCSFCYGVHPAEICGAQLVHGGGGCSWFPLPTTLRLFGLWLAGNRSRLSGGVTD